METIHQLILLNQSVRSKMFMFLYRILMAVIMTNFSMNKLGFEYNGADINFKNTYCFIISNEFLLVMALYVFYVFLFFWAFRMIIGLLVINHSFNVPLKDELIKILIAINVLEWDDGRLVFLGEFKRLIYESVNDVYLNDKVYDIIYIIVDVLNILLSTSIVYFSTNNSERFLPSWIGWILAIISLLALYAVHYAIFTIMKFVHLPEVLAEINQIETQESNDNNTNS